jgi:hypothetical protein
MRFALTITAEYEVSDDRLMKAYQTTDPTKCAQIDEENFLNEIDLPDYCEDIAVTVRAV